jgi:hypothetical protein
VPDSGDGDTSSDAGADTAVDARPADAASDADTSTDAADVSPDVADPLSVGWCRLQWPVVIDAVEGSPFTAYGRVFVDSVTNRTASVDVDVRVIAQFGWGDDGTSPGPGWLWFDAAPNPDWDATAASEPGNDEYELDFRVPSAASSPYDFAWRFSADGGETWLYCDQARGTGRDGSQNGYSPADAGAMTARPPAATCATTTCDAVPLDDCTGDFTLAVYDAVGVCIDTDAGPICDYPFEEVDCLEAGAYCADGACIEFPVPGAGDLVITEVAPSNNGAATAWIELASAASLPLDIAACDLEDADGNAVSLASVALVEPGARLTLAATDAATIDGAVVPDVRVAPATFSLEAGRSARIVCAGTEVDAVVLPPLAYPGRSLQVDSRDIDSTRNDDLDNWCNGSRQIGTAAAWGSPGAANDTCDDVAVAWCRLQHPASVEVDPASPFNTFGRLYSAGITTRSSRNDLHPRVVAQAGLGGRGTAPGPSWTWTPAAPTPGYDGTVSGEPDNDEFRATLTAPASGSTLYDFAWRVSGDNGVSWRYCDRDTGSGRDGSEDGYSPDDAGKLRSLIDVCASVVCSEPPASGCEGFFAATTYAPTGVCAENLDGVAACSYPPTETACVGAQICVDGACVPAAAPTHGELVFTEVMPLIDGAADSWVELVVDAAAPRSLDGCVLQTSSGAGVDLSELGAVVPGDVLVIAGTSGASIEGVVVPTLSVERDQFAVLPVGETVVLVCDAVVIDEIEVPAAEVYPRRSLQLDPAATDVLANNLRANWCQGAAEVGESSVFGSPGAANASCGPVDVDWCRLQFPAALEAARLDVVNVYGRVYSSGLTDRGPDTDLAPALIAQVGLGADGSMPGASWLWFAASPTVDWDGATRGEPNNDEFVGSVVVPDDAAGDYDFAYRVSGNSGASWTYCDLDMGGPSDGSEDGYEPANAGSLFVEPPVDPCSPNPCTAPPSPTCADDFSIRLFPSTGTCSPSGDTVTCDYGAGTPTACAEGAVCFDNACVGSSSSVVGWCRLQFPSTISAASETIHSVYGRVYVAGITDRSVGVDRVPGMIAQLGVGPDNTSPTDLSWTWSTASANPGWNGSVWGEPNNDEYVGSITVAADGPAMRDYAFRFTADGGQNWAYCDIDGLTNGYSQSQAGSLTRIP